MEKLYNILIVKYGEIGVKGKNRYIFENKLIKNVKNIQKQERKIIKNRKSAIYTLQKKESIV